MSGMSDWSKANLLHVAGNGVVGKVGGLEVLHVHVLWHGVSSHVGVEGVKGTR